MKKTIMFALVFAAVAAVADEQYWSADYLTRVGWNAGWNAYGLGKSSLYGAGAGAYGRYIQESTLAGAAAGSFASNCFNVVGIGHRALKKGFNLNDIVAIGDGEMAEARDMTDVTSINGQLFISGNKTSSGGVPPWAGFWLRCYRDEYMPPEEYATLYYTCSNDVLRIIGEDVVFTNMHNYWGYAPQQIYPTNTFENTLVCGDGTLLYRYGLFPIEATFTTAVDGHSAGYEFSFNDAAEDYGDAPVKWRHVIWQENPQSGDLIRVNEWQCYVSLHVPEEMDVVLARFDDVTGEYKGYLWDGHDSLFASAPFYDDKYRPSPIMPNPQPLSLRSTATKLNALKGKTYNFYYDAEKENALADLIELFGGTVTNYVHTGP